MKHKKSSTKIKLLKKNKLFAKNILSGNQAANVKKIQCAKNAFKNYKQT
jgi:hypothetical protein